MQRHVVLLRGINLGSRRRVGMAALRELLGGLRYEDVRTLLQSGNIVLGSGASAEQVARRLGKEISESVGFDVEVVVRSRDELAEVVARDPLGEIAEDPKRYQVYFLSAEPDAAAIERAAAADLAPERFVHVGREIYSWHPEGIQRSKLGPLLAADRLGVTATARNWNTVLKLLEMADA
ncbi:MAG: DUF1697 domain-containing protein [Solirubrobacteraceae bacterium]